MRSVRAHDLPFTRAYVFAPVFLKYRSMSNGPALRRALSELPINVFNIVNTVRHLSQSRGHVQHSEDSSLGLRPCRPQQFLLLSSIFQTYLLYLPSHAAGLTDTNRTTLANVPPQMSCLSLCSQRLECICVLEHTNHPVSATCSDLVRLICTLLQDP